MTTASASATGHRALPFEPRTGLLVILILGVLVIFTALIPGFLSVSGISNILRQWSVLLIVASGATLVIVAGEIDLSVGSVVALVSVLTAWVSRMDAGILAMLALAIGVGLCIGAVNAFLSLALRVPSFLATLGTLLVIRGLAMTLSLQPMAVRDLTFITFFRKTTFGLPMPFLLAAAAVLVLWVVLHRTRFGTLIRAVGSNPESARLAGIPVIRYKTLVLMLGSVLAALGGLVLAGRTNFGMAQSATGLELDVIAAVVLGGGRLGGGRGSIPGTALGALLLTLIFTGIAILGLPGPYQDLVKGAMIGLAIVLMRK